MGFFNWIGLIFVLIILIPNIIFSFLKKVDYNNYNIPSTIEKMEMFGRGGSMLFMVFNIPSLTDGFFFENGLLVYVIINTILVILYVLLYCLLINKDTMFKSISLSSLPSLVFLFSGSMIQSIPLIICGVIFGFNHINISIKNYIERSKKNE